MGVGTTPNQLACFLVFLQKTEGSKHAGLLDQLFETFAGRDQNDKMHESQNEERGDKDHPDHIDKSMLAHEQTETNRSWC